MTTSEEETKGGGSDRTVLGSVFPQPAPVKSIHIAGRLPCGIYVAFPGLNPATAEIYSLRDPFSLATSHYAALASVQNAAAGRPFFTLVS